MNRFGPEVEETIKLARAKGAKVSVFDDRGCLLWFCDCWEADVGTVQRWAQALGWGWLEFVHEEDVASVRSWIEGPDGMLVEFRTVAPEDPSKWTTVRLIKHRVGLYWVAIGVRRSLGEQGAAVLVAAATFISSLGNTPWWARMRDNVCRVIECAPATIARNGAVDSRRTQMPRASYPRRSA